jgi:SAM-dependent methyltransferase
MYPWVLTDAVTTPVMNPELPSIHHTRAELIEDPVREALTRAGAEARALDLACNEGWFSHRLLEWGASQVVAVDIRQENIRRAQLLRDHFTIPEERFQLINADVYALRPEMLGQFDVVLLLGLVYHVEDPMGLIRRARAFTRSVCAIESQLTRQEAPILHGWGRSDQVEQAPGSFAVRVEPDGDSNPLASAPGVMSLIPNRMALEQMTRLAGFGRTQFATPNASHNRQYVSGDRGVLIARPD